MQQSLHLTDPVAALRGIGEKKAAAFARLGVRIIGDLLRFYPRTYDDRRQLYPVYAELGSENRQYFDRCAGTGLSGNQN